MHTIEKDDNNDAEGDDTSEIIVVICYYIFYDVKSNNAEKLWEEELCIRRCADIDKLHVDDDAQVLNHMKELAEAADEEDVQ